MEPIAIVSFMLIFGWLGGIFYGYKMVEKKFKNAMKMYSEELLKQYQTALDKMRIKYINENNTNILTNSPLEIIDPGEHIPADVE